MAKSDTSNPTLIVLDDPGYAGKETAKKWFAEIEASRDLSEATPVIILSVARTE